jgi:hypothetical protein
LSPLVTYGTGWLAAGLLCVAASGPLVVRLFHFLNRPVASWLLQSHYRLGGVAAIAGVVHTLVSVTRAQAVFAAEVGLWLASASAGLLVIEAVLGSSMRDPRAPNPRRSRQRHLAIMLALVTMVALHAALNGPFAI